MDFCSYPPAHLVDFFATESTEKAAKSTDLATDFADFHGFSIGNFRLVFGENWEDNNSFAKRG